MVLDTRIAMGVQPLDVGASLGRGYQLRDLAMQAEARKLDNQAKQRAIQKQATLGDLYKGSLGADGSVDRAKLTQGMIGAGYGADLPELQKGWGEMDKAQAESRSKMLENGIKANNYITSQIAGLMMKQDRSPADAYAAIDHLAQMGFLPPDQVQQYRLQVPTNNPQAMDNWLRTMLVQSLEGKEQLAALLPKVSAENLGSHTQMVDTNPLTNPGVVGQRLERSATPGDLITDRHYRASEGLQARGQNMADARARESNATALSRPFEVTGPDNKPMLVQQDKAGNIRPVTNYMPKKSQDTLTEGERKAATLLQRLEFSEKQLQEATSENAEAKKPELAASAVRSIGLETAANAMTGEQRQRVESAQLDILDAALTLGTGAAYTREQLEGYRRSYFPQIGDSAKTVKDKNARLKNVIEAARIAAGRAGTKGQGSDASDRTDEEPKIVDFSDLK